MQGRGSSPPRKLVYRGWDCPRADPWSPELLVGANGISKMILEPQHLGGEQRDKSYAPGVAEGFRQVLQIHKTHFLNRGQLTPRCSHSRNTKTFVCKGLGRALLPFSLWLWLSQVLWPLQQMGANSEPVPDLRPRDLSGPGRAGEAPWLERSGPSHGFAKVWMGTGNPG